MSYHLHHAAIFVVGKVYGATYDHLLFECLALGAIDYVEMSVATLGNDGGCRESPFESYLHEFYLADVLFQ